MTETRRPGVSWARIVGEFVVIVTGVLVALTVDSCYRDRQDRAAEADYLNRLLADVQSDTASLRFQATIISEKVAALDLVAGAIRSNEVPDDTLAFLRAVKRGTAFSWGMLRLRTVTYDDLVGTGSLALITGPEVRARVLDYHRNAAHRINRVEDRATGSGDLIYRLVPAEILSAFPQTDPRAPGNLAREAATPDTDVDAIMPLAAVALGAIRNDEFLGALNAERNYALFTAAMVEETMDQAGEALATLGTATNQRR